MYSEEVCSEVCVMYLLIDSQMWLDSFLHTLITLSYYHTPDLSPGHVRIYTLHHIAMFIHYTSSPFKTEAEVVHFVEDTYEP